MDWPRLVAVTAGRAHRTGPASRPEIRDLHMSQPPQEFPTVSPQVTDACRLRQLAHNAPKAKRQVALAFCFRRPAHATGREVQRSAIDGF